MDEIAYVDPQLMSNHEAFTIPVGTMAVVPHQDHANLVDAMEEGETNTIPLPEGTILMGGQELSRELYPELSREYGDTGGFHTFILPNLTKKFIIGVDHETGEFLWGDGVIYYETFPKVEVPIRDIRQFQ